MLKEKEPVLCGFVWCHGFKDFSVYEIDLTEEDQNAIETILEKYREFGTSERNCYDSTFHDVFHAEY